MPFPIEKKLVIAVTSSALFDMRESDGIFQTLGEEEHPGPNGKRNHVIDRIEWTNP